MKRIIILCVAAFFCLVIYFRGDIIDVVKMLGMSKNEREFVRSLKQFVKSDKKSIPLKELTNFEWEKVCWFGPYQPDDTVKSKMNDCMVWQGDSCMSHESYWGIQFMHKGNASSVCISRRIIDCPREPVKCVLQDGATAKLERRGYKQRALQIEGISCNDSK